MSKEKLIDLNQFHVLIPARSGSKRISDKNCQVIDKKSLIQWAVESAIETGIRSVLSTNIQKFTFRHQYLGADILCRPEAICGPNSTDLDVIKHFLRHFPCDFIIYLRPTSPFRKKEILIRAIQSFIKKEKEIDSLRSVEKTPESALKWFHVEPSGICRTINPSLTIEETNLPSQKLEPTYKPNGIIDIFKRSVIEYGSLCGSNILGFITEPTIEIDTAQELEYARWYAQNLWIK